MLDWGWIGDHLGPIGDKAIQHLTLAAIAVVVGFLLSFGLALLAVARRRTYPPITLLAGILYTIPALALFSALVSITGISILTAEVPLVIYTLVILVRNIVVGFDSVPPEVLEAADGMGYTRLARLARVELPLAIPFIVAGLRLASVSTIGLVTITATLGDRFGGLGFFILEGWRHYFPTEIYAGGVASILLAIAVDVVFVVVQRALTPWARARASRSAA